MKQSKAKQSKTKQNKMKQGNRWGLKNLGNGIAVENNKGNRIVQEFSHGG
jgi:hypothetical protein